MLNRLLAGLTMALVLTSSTFATGHGAEIGKGTLELALAGAFERTSFEDSDLTSFDLGTRLTYSLTNRFATGGTVGFSHLSTASGNDATSVYVGVDFVANFPTQSSIVPFAQLSFGLTSWAGDFYDDADLTYSLPFVGAGFRTILGDHASVNILAGYRHQVNAFGVEDITAHDIIVSFGLSVFPNGIQ